MRYILSFILVFLLNLPNCGMVFAGMMNEGMGHSTSNDISMAASHENGDIGEAEYNCCSHSNDGSPRNVVTSSSEAKTISIVSHILSHPLRLEDLPQPSLIVYQINAPPDPWDYCSLVGSVKRLD